jgi:alpha-D-xyloside xylohydrolase
MRCFRIFLFFAIAGIQTAFGQLTFTKDSTGVWVAMSSNRTMYVQVCSPGIIRAVYAAGTTIPGPMQNVIVVQGSWPTVAWDTSSTATTYTITTSQLMVNIDKTSGAISYNTAAGAPIVNEIANAKQLTPTSISGVNAYTGALAFNGTSTEGLYGFGQFQSGILNQNGLTDSLAQHNTTDCSPMFISTRGFGVLWINYSRAAVSPPINLTCAWATNNAIEYYFMYGPEFDQIIASYRTITGQAVMWPKWAYGFWQCRNLYASELELLNVVREYRAKNYPIDNIVQDWNYYPPGFDGCQCFDHTRYPYPAGMIDTLHNLLHCHFTISVWPSFTATPGNNNYYFMSNNNYLLPVNDALGQTYDAFNDSATFYYWKFINDSLVTKNVDAFWPDATEPESVGWPYCGTALGPGQEYGNLFPFMHSQTLYNGYRKANNNLKRVTNLTRSYYAGSQRLGAAYWTGDVGIDFPTFQEQTPAGLNFCMTGMPLFCTDIGGFSGPNYADLEIRWFECGAFYPVFRVHGTRTCNQVWCWNNDSGGNLSYFPQAESMLVKYLNLRYRLFPYVYSMAGMVTQQSYTMMRALAFDFRSDPKVYNLSNEFMFGPAFLVCPVTTAAATTQGATLLSVYLPASTWYNFWTGDTLISPAGRTISINSPLDTMPLFIRAGSIVPMGMEIKYADSAADPIELRVYTGANGSFTLYEDEGDNYNYENGAFATIPITWTEATQMLTIGPTSGSFPGMLTSRTFKVVWVSHLHGAGEPITADSVIDKVIPYYGGMVSLNKTTGQIGVKYFPGIPKSATFVLRLTGRSLLASLGGNGTWQVRLTNLSGKTIVYREVRGGTQATIAEGLASGTYVVNMKYNNLFLANKKILVQ